MDQPRSFQAILFPSDGRPHMVSLMTSLILTVPGHHAYPQRLPRPEQFMDYISKGLGPRAWKYQLVEALDGMNCKFTHPYIIFYPTVSSDGLPFPLNNFLRKIQGPAFKERLAWRGNIVVAKYEGNPFSSMIDASIADFPILKNYFMTHGSPSP
ncbi:hypothetical protein EYR40_003192 [Pleurotus pulmonarius]|nr:hypothetical protein EYR40_003192 [Pleurotus pulmonarius]